MKRILIFFVIIAVFLTACVPLRSQKSRKNPYSEFSVEEQNKFLEMYMAVYYNRIEEVKQLLDEGYDPDRCRGGTGSWETYNPLDVANGSFYNAYYGEKLGEEMPDPLPDVAIFRLLVEAGADVNRRPYIWWRIRKYDEQHVEMRLAEKRRGQKTQEEAAEDIAGLVRDSNRLIEEFLKAGADPDRLGHVTPYDYEAMVNGITEEEAEEYFAKGTRALNEAIKKGIWWEEQVDLLLRYTSLDEASLEAAYESNDPAMIGKISRLWIAQRQGG
jgi:hypothetical protein